MDGNTEAILVRYDATWRLYSSGLRFSRFNKSGEPRAFSFSCLVGKAHHVESFAEMGIVAA